METALKKLGKYKYLLLVLAFGLVLMLLPTGKTASLASSGALASDVEARLEEVLSDVEGVGKCAVLCSDEGAVVVCEGAESPVVRLNVVNAVRGYTGFGSGDIEVLKMRTN